MNESPLREQFYGQAQDTSIEEEINDGADESSSHGYIENSCPKGDEVLDLENSYPKDEWAFGTPEIFKFEKT